jgi:hypothetical protein
MEGEIIIKKKMFFAGMLAMALTFGMAPVGKPVQHINRFHTLPSRKFLLYPFYLFFRICVKMCINGPPATKIRSLLLYGKTFGEF